MFSHRFQELSDAVNTFIYSGKSTPLLETDAFQATSNLLTQSARNNGIVYTIGNGGSAGIASHFSNDLMKTLNIPSQTLYDSNLLTCLSNDLGYEHVFSYPLERLLTTKDLLVIISSSGKSANVVKAAEVAIAKTIPVITLTGFQENNPLRKLGDLNFWVDRSDYGLVETAHFFILHAIIDLLVKHQSMVLSCPN